jgi:hypothetical protein
MLEFPGAAGKQLTGKMQRKSKYSEKTAKTEVSAATLSERWYRAHRKMIIGKS